jgi:hypothetical protein
MYESERLGICLQCVMEFASDVALQWRCKFGFATLITDFVLHRQSLLLYIHSVETTYIFVTHGLHVSTCTVVRKPYVSLFHKSLLSYVLHRHDTRFDKNHTISLFTS